MNGKRFILVTDDIVTQLLHYAPPTCSACDTWGVCGYGEHCDCTCHSSPHYAAAKEIEKLRSAGEALAIAYWNSRTDQKDDTYEWDSVVYYQWKKIYNPNKD